MILLILAVCVAFVASVRDDCVTFWEHRLGVGKNWEKCAGNHNVIAEGRYFSSFEVGKNVMVTVFQAHNYGGKRLTAAPGDKILYDKVIAPLGFNDKMLSAKIEKVVPPKDHCVRFYAGYLGDPAHPHWDICEGDHAKLDSKIATQTSSLWVGKDAKVTVFSEPDFKGKSVSGASGSLIPYSIIGGNGMNDKVWSAKIASTKPILDPNKGCYNYEGAYRKGFKQCGYDAEHFRSSKGDKATAEDVASIDKILDDMEHDFKKKGEEEIKKVRFAFDEKKKAYLNAGKLQSEFEIKQLSRMNHEDKFDQARYEEEQAHKLYVAAVLAYNKKVTAYKAAHAAHVKAIDFLNYELFIVHQIRELLGPKLGKEVIVQTVLKYEPLNKKWGDFEFKYKQMKEAQFDHKRQRFVGGADPGAEAAKIDRRKRRRRRRRRRT